MEENYVTVIVSKAALHAYQKAIDALRDAESAFEIASENLRNCKDSDGSVVKDAVDLVVAARKAKSDAAFELAEDARTYELGGTRRPLSGAEKARRGAEYLKKRLDDIKSFGRQSDCELQA